MHHSRYISDRISKNFVLLVQIPMSNVSVTYASHTYAMTAFVKKDYDPHETIE